MLASRNPNIHGSQAPDGISDKQNVEVVDDYFKYDPSTFSFLGEMEEYCLYQRCFYPQ